MTTQHPRQDFCFVTIDQVCLALSFKPNSFHVNFSSSYHTNANSVHSKVKCYLAFTVSMVSEL